MILVAGLALALIVVALLRRGASNEEIVSRISRERDPRVVTAAAQILAGRGMRLTAEALLSRAQSLAQSAKPAVGGSVASTLRSPFPEATDTAWTGFVRALMGVARETRSNDGRIGRFGIHLRRLAELDLVTSLRRNEEGQLEADWVPPLTEQRFLADPRVQYRALVATLGKLRRVLTHRHAGAPGMVEGRRVSLSGWLALAHLLGPTGTQAWLASGTERLRQPAATRLFERCNDLF